MMNIKDEVKMLDDEFLQYSGVEDGEHLTNQEMLRAWGLIDNLEKKIINVSNVHKEWIKLNNQILAEANNIPYIESYFNQLNNIFNDETKRYIEIRNSMNSVMFSYNDALNSMLPVSGDIQSNMSVLETQLLEENKQSYEPIKNHHYKGPLLQELTKKTSELLSAFRETSNITNKIFPEISSLYEFHIKPQLINDASSLINDLISGNAGSILTMFAQRVENTLEDMSYWSEPLQQTEVDMELTSTEDDMDRVIGAVSCFGTDIDRFEIIIDNLNSCHQDTARLVSLTAVK